jgi:hypothetical protein
MMVVENAKQDHTGAHIKTRDTLSCSAPSHNHLTAPTPLSTRCSPLSALRLPSPPPPRRYVPALSGVPYSGSQRVQAAAAFANISLETPTKVAKKLFDDAKLPESPKSVTEEQLDDLTKLRRQYVGEVDLPESMSRRVSRIWSGF